MLQDIIVFDFETGGRDPFTCQPTQIAAVAVDGRNFKKKGEFNSYIWAETDHDKAVEAGLAPIEDGALEVTSKFLKTSDSETAEQKQMRYETYLNLIRNAPKPEAVWHKFTAFVNKYNWKQTPFFRPVPAGYNIINYDLPIVERLCKLYGPWDKKKQKSALFHDIFKVDMMHNYFMWTEGDPSCRSRSLDTIRDMMGTPQTNAHDALADTKFTANLMVKFLKTHRSLYQRLDFSKAFADGQMFIE